MDEEVQPERMSSEIVWMDKEPGRIPELKHELRNLATEMIADDFVDNQKLIKMSKLVKSLKINSDSDTQPAPQEFRCPISEDIMMDPVLIVSGHTFERSYIQDYLNLGHRNCPVSGQELYDCMLIPNRSLKKRISTWCDTSSSPSQHLHKVTAKEIDNLLAELPSPCSIPEAKAPSISYLTESLRFRPAGARTGATTSLATRNSNDNDSDSGIPSANLV